MKEAAENKVKISDFSFEIVEKAVKLCYRCIPVSDSSVGESLLLLKFADKYDMCILKVMVYYVFIIIQCFFLG